MENNVLRSDRNAELFDAILSNKTSGLESFVQIIKIINKNYNQD